MRLPHLYSLQLFLVLWPLAILALSRQAAGLTWPDWSHTGILAAIHEVRQLTTREVALSTDTKHSSTELTPAILLQILGPQPASLAVHKRGVCLLDV